MRARQSLFVLLPLSLHKLVTARLHHSLVPEDPYAFPKYRVTFLNGLPVLNQTAQSWLQNGLRGGELEFLDQPWEGDIWSSPHLKSIDGVSQHQDVASPAQFELELMKFGPRASYLCLIPPPPQDTPNLAHEESTDVTPVHTWSLLQPLAGTCLYHRQGWFTYSYCHNVHVRQFHELANPQAQRPGEYKPEEDEEWESYTLGRAPPTLDPGADLTVAEEAALAANVELARGAGSRYLVQRWGGGTYCDKTGRKREIEIQFHCSMTMTDTILFVKETSTCHYVLHIATPRLCGEPGFKSRHDSRDEAFIRCREIVSTEEYEAADRKLQESDVPKHLLKKTKPVIAPPPPATVPQDKETKQAAKKAQHELIRKALERLLQGGDLKAGEVMIESFGDGDEEVVIEFVEADFKPDRKHETNGDSSADSGETNLEDILRAAGFDVIGEKGEKRGGKARSESTREGSKEENIEATHHTVKTATPSAEPRVTQDQEESQGTASSTPQPRDEL